AGRVALAVGVVLVDEDPLLGRRHGLGPLPRQVQDPLARAVPDDGVARVRRLRARILRVGVVHVEARAVGQDQVDQARLFLGGALLLLHVLEAARIAERALRLVVPAHARRAV